MALGYTFIEEDVWGKTRVTTFDIKLDTSYPATGYAFSPPGVSAIRGVQVIGIKGTIANSGGVGIVFDLTNTASPRLRAFFPSGGASAPTSLIAPVVGTTVIPAGATAVTSSAAQPTLVAAAVTGGLGIEVGTTADLSTVTVRVMIFSH